MRSRHRGPGGTSNRWLRLDGDPIPEAHEVTPKDDSNCSPRVFDSSRAAPAVIAGRVNGER
jgi:hypothetical protein